MLMRRLNWVTPAISWYLWMLSRMFSGPLHGAANRPSHPNRRPTWLRRFRIDLALHFEVFTLELLFTSPQIFEEHQSLIHP